MTARHLALGDRTQETLELSLSQKSDAQLRAMMALDSREERREAARLELESRR
jgi:hypothetical protein